MYIQRTLSSTGRRQASSIVLHSGGSDASLQSIPLRSRTNTKSIGATNLDVDVVGCPGNDRSLGYHELRPSVLGPLLILQSPNCCVTTRHARRVVCVARVVTKVSLLSCVSRRHRRACSNMANDEEVVLACIQVKSFVLWINIASGKK